MIDQEDQLAYWVRQLADSSPAELLTDRSRPALPSSNANYVSVEINRTVHERLQLFAHAQQTTPSVVILAAFRAAHYRLIGSEDATIGILTVPPDKHRIEDETDASTISHCMRITVNSSDTFEALVSQVRATTVAAQANQDVSFKRLVSRLIPKWKDASRHPLVQLAFVLHPEPEPDEKRLKTTIMQAPCTAENTYLDAELHLFQGPDKITGYLVFTTDLFEKVTIQCLRDIFQEVLRRGLEQPQALVETLPLLDGLDQLHRLSMLEIESTDFPRDSSIVDIFQEQVYACPDRVAVKDATSQLTYAELDQQSDKLAHWLHQKHLAAETPIGVLAPRSCEAIVSFFGILKANLAYLPLDVNVPIVRIEAILSAIPAEKLVLLGADVNVSDNLADAQLLRIHNVLDQYVDVKCTEVITKPTATNLAYVIFTSGSTGKPKGVMVEHRGVVRLVKHCNYVTALPQRPRIAHLANLAFDASIWEICSAMLNGGTLICVEQSTLLDIPKLEAVITRETVEVMTLSPAMLKMILVSIPDMLCPLHVLFMAGDRLDSEDANRVRSLLKGRAYNLYGPSENTVGSTIHRLSNDDPFTNGTPIGRSINNSGAYVMDPQQKLVSIGVLGELVLTGDGLARGYTNPALDSGRFVEVVIEGQLTRAYRTGDRVRWRPIDGLLEFFGRIDNQIKIRGYRVELAEVEHVILKDTSVNDAAVVLRSSGDEESEIVGFVTTRGSHRTLHGSQMREVAMRIRKRLQNLLPTYMIPAQIIVLQEMPLNASSKVDRKELSRKAQIAPRFKPSEASYTGPRNEVEAALCEELTAMLGFKVSVSDNFFELGGHSLMATKLAARVSRRLGTRISVKDIFDHPVMADLADYMRLNPALRSSIASLQYVGPTEQSFAQGRLWFLDQLNLHASWYLIPLAVRLHGHLNKPALKRALDALVQRHETLRTTFKSHDGVGLQVVHADMLTELRDIDMSGEDTSSHLLTLQREQMAPFDLASEPGWRVSLLQLGKDDYILSIVMHHIISDGWSIDILRQELDRFYTVALRGDDPLSSVDTLHIQYRDFSLWQRQEEQAEEHERQLTYWTQQLAGSSPAEIPVDYPRPALLSGEAGVVELTINGALYRSLQTFSRSRQTTPFTLLLTAFRISHFRLTGSEDALIGMPIANRNRPELESMIGFFVNTQCIRITVSYEDTFETLVRQVRATTLEAQVNQDVPFERVVSALLPRLRDLSKTPLVQLDFVLHSQIGLDKIHLEGLHAEPIPRPATTRADVEFHMFEGIESMTGQVLFASDLFKIETIQNMVDVFQEVLRRGLEEPQMPIISLPLVGGLRRLRDMGLLETNRTNYPRESSIVDIFHEQVYAYPNVIAVKDTMSQLTYAELDQQSNKLAYWLRQRRMTAEALVGVLAPRSCETITTFLGILKAGLAYLPLDTKAPINRIQVILSSIPGNKLVLIGKDIPVPDASLADVDLVRIGEILNQYDQSGIVDWTLRPSATSLAYVIFTSGSTGIPKGVMVEHRGVVRLVRSSLYMQKLPTAPRVAHSANLAFDTSVWEIYTALLNGGTLVCLDVSTVLDIGVMEALFLRERIQAASIPPALLKLCLAAYPAMFSTLDVLLSGGDRLEPKDALKAQALVKGCVFNAYGPTENTVDSVQYRISNNDLFTNGTPIGRSINNSGAYVMDPQQKLVSMGVLGELVLTGDGLARGYTNPALDSGRFVEVVIEGQLTRAYRTGDRARWRPIDGLLEFFGRIDNQIKIRGYRVELAEVEHVILKDTLVDDAAVVLRSSEDEESEMVGFVTTREGESTPQEDVCDQLDGWEGHFESCVYTDIDTINETAIGRDFYSWTSMYNGSVIDKTEMQEWLDDTMHTLIDGTEAGDVLEIGTGTGMILFNLGGGLRSYIGLEPAKSAATFVNNIIKSNPSLAGKAQVHVGSASDLYLIDKLDPDLIVLNSVIQYFPSPDYLTEVIDSLIHLPRVKRLFFGDVRSFALNNEFLASRALYKLGRTASKSDVRREILELEEQEEELLIDPAYFTALAGIYPGRVHHVEILPKRMKATNELSSFRYTAVVHLRDTQHSTLPTRTIAADTWIDFQSSQMDRQALLHILRSSCDTLVFAFATIPNSKIVAHRHIIESLRSDEDISRGTENEKAWIQAAEHEARHCYALSAWDLVQIGEQTGFSVELSWARQRSHHGALDVIFHRFPTSTKGTRVMFKFPTEVSNQSAEVLTNRPLRRRQWLQLGTQIHKRLQNHLPTYMIPAQIIVLQEMPLNASNKVDRKELSRKAQIAPRFKPSEASYTEPRNKVETALCEELAAVLRFKVGVSDNFFELGGHSLMATKLAARVSRRLGTRISVKDIFDHPVMADLATELQLRKSRNPIPVTGPSRSQQISPFVLLSSNNPETFVRDIVRSQIRKHHSGAVLDVYPVTHTQQIYLHDSLTGLPRAPSLFFTDFPSGSDINSLRSACEALVQRFDIFRTVFLFSSGQYYQVVLDALDVPIEIVSCDGDITDATMAIADEDNQLPLVVGRSFLRITLLQKPNSTKRVLLRMSHALYDGLSLENILRSLHVLSKGGSLPAAPRFVQYMSGMVENRKAGYNHWRSLLQHSSMTQIPAAHSAQPNNDGIWYMEKRIDVVAPSKPKCGITQATIFTTACAQLLANHFGLRDVVFGRDVSGRQCLPFDSEAIVGPCTNTVPVRLNIGGDTSPLLLLQKVQNQYLDCLSFETLGLDEIRKNCTDWPETVTQYGCCTAYHNFNVNPESRIQNQRIQLYDMRPETWIDRSPIYDMEMEAYPSSDQRYLRITVQISRRICDKNITKKLLDDLCKHFTVLVSKLY
ncbi:hypothetical protein QQS21_010947 [Conoideocrella luteorostrata]|uniref:Carrier domain-containing protein n=1 Tax=Conoideocrella luteorostrata TaxID=1105319 RepID=A0AAJ0CEC1_9HYPO|nr:hypothetical protein QQS21_010947 [Conoideocrella luteorostrata]